MKIIVTFMLLFATSSAYSQVFLGTWEVTKIRYQNMTSGTQEGAEGLIGKTLIYSLDYAKFGKSICEEITYESEQFTDRQLNSFYKTFLENLDLDGIDQITNVEVLCDNRAWNNFGHLFVYTKDEELFVNMNGYFYELKRKDS